MKKIIFIFIFIIASIVLAIYYFFQDRTALYVLVDENLMTSTSYKFSKNNHLRMIASPLGTIAYSIDKHGLKIDKSIDNKIVERYFWLGGERLKLVTDLDGKVLRQYIYKNKHDALPAEMIADGQRFRFIFNPQKNLRVVLDEQEQLAKVLEYDKNGFITKDTNPFLKIDFAYGGGIWDEDAQLLFYTQGVYDPVAKHWISKVKNIDILENIKQLESLDDSTVYRCSATFDTYYHSFLCTKQQCGGLYAVEYLDYFNGKGALLDNSIYFNYEYCQPIILPKHYDQNIFSLCVQQKIQPRENLLFDAWKHNCHHEVNNIINQCKKSAYIKEKS